MSDTADDLGSEKLQAIRDSALDAFLRYGTKRTSMEDIATGAGMSRAALYLHFKNKNDILQSVISGLYDQAARRFKGELDPAKPVAEAVSNAIRLKDGGLMAKVMASPHCADMIGVGQEVASAQIEAGEARLVAILQAYFETALDLRNADPQTPPAVLANHIMQICSALAMKPGPEERASLLGRTAAQLLGVD